MFSQLLSTERSVVQMAPLKVASEVPSGHMGASGLSSGSLGWSRSSWGTMMAERRIGLAQPTLRGPLDKNRTRASLPWSFSVPWGEADDIRWGRGDWEAPFPPRWKVQEVLESHKQGAAVEGRSRLTPPSWHGPV